MNQSKIFTSKFLPILWLLLLSMYILSGMRLASFHGDEAMQIWMSEDYATAFIERQPLRLMTGPPYFLDSPNQLRILNGSVNRYAIGLSWHVAGLTRRDLPPIPGWDWGMSFERNAATDHVPSDALLFAGRISSTLFLCLSAAVMFGIGRQIGGRPLAYIASGLYALHPAILLNGRRAMMEGSFLFFGLLTVLVAIILSRKREAGERGLWRWWLGLILSSGLALASKHTAIVFLASAFAWIFIVEIFRPRQPLDLLKMSAQLALSLVLIIVLFVALSPALWNDPAERFRNLLSVRQELIDIQIEIDPLAPMTFSQRLEKILIQPFIAPAQHFELLTWAYSKAFMAQVERYDASLLGGIHFGWLLGLPLTILAGVGVVSLFAGFVGAQGLAPLQPLSRGQRLALLGWLVITAASLLVNPLPWQRYYLPLIPVVIILTGIGCLTVIGWIVGKPQHMQPQSTLAS